MSDRTMTTVLLIVALVASIFGTASLDPTGRLTAHDATAGFSRTISRPLNQLTAVSPSTLEDVPAGTRIYVDDSATTGACGGTPDGSSWACAFTDLQQGLAVALAGDEIWMAGGLYTPGETISDTFTLVPGVAIYGGFAGTEALPAERDLTEPDHRTILSGDIAGDDLNADGNHVAEHASDIQGENSIHVLIANGTGGLAFPPSTVLDGLTITAGSATGSGENSVGGGFVCTGDGPAMECSPSLRNLVFAGNQAYFGGALFFGDSGGGSLPILTDATFGGNRAITGGGAMYASTDQGVDSPRLVNVHFLENRSDYVGGAMYNVGIYGVSNPKLANVTFTENEADYGGAMFNDGYRGISSPTLENVTFSANSAYRGGAIYNNSSGLDAESSPTLTNVVFEHNTADISGGAIYSASFEDSSSSPILVGVTFSANVSDYGGAMYNDTIGGNSSPSLVDVVFTGNRAADGGAMYNRGEDGVSSPTLVNVVFAGNLANGNGGAIINDGWHGESSPRLANALFVANRATACGGALWNYGYAGLSNPSLINVTFASNNAADCGGALRNWVSNPSLVNVILWGNTAGNSGSQIHNTDSSPTIDYSLVQGGDAGSNEGTAYSDGTGNIDANPLFLRQPGPGPDGTWGTGDDDFGNLRVQTVSPAINSGDVGALWPNVTTDLDGFPRVFGTTVDMGPYESLPGTYLPVMLR